jgi:hypothetical protein
MSGNSEFRKSQGVVPFGVGSIIDFPNESLMMAGLDVWPYELAVGEMRSSILDSSQITDGRLARRLTANLGRRVSFFISPSEAPDGFGYGTATQALEGRARMPFVRFPNWHFCPRCRVMKRISWNTQRDDEENLRCSNMGRRVDGSGDPCGSLYKRSRPTLAPVRFIAACENGHIFDFPWARWVHGNGKKDCDGGSGDLYIYSTPQAGLAGVMIQCVKCQLRRSMGSSFTRDKLGEIYGTGCPGERPWLGPNAAESCDCIPQTIQRGASNAYFAKVISSILIPPFSALLQQTLDRPDIWREIISTLVNGDIHEPFLRAKAENLGHDPELFIRAVREKLQDEEQDGNDTDDTNISEEEYRLAEYRAYLGPRPPRQERHDFDTQALVISAFPSWFGELFEAAVLVRKLRETRVLTGFSRIVPPEAHDATPAALSVRERDWLPAFEVRGEGIFLKLRKERLDDWSKRTFVAARIAPLAARLNDLRRQREQDPRFISPALLLIHTFAHLLIRQMSFECGYDASSLRERLYVSTVDADGMYGLLIYTASGDAEGTLGGLVRQGEPGRLDNTIKAAMGNAAICSSDPLCIESLGQGTSGLNFAACHACALLPETSCEEGNLLLDRGLVIGTPDEPDLGYFAGLLAEQ